MKCFRKGQAEELYHTALKKNTPLSQQLTEHFVKGEDSDNGVGAQRGGRVLDRDYAHGTQRRAQPRYVDWSDVEPGGNSESVIWAHPAPPAAPQQRLCPPFPCRARRA